MRKLGVGVLGVGEMGRRHAENIRRLVPGARLVAVADVAVTRAKEVAARLEIEHSFGSFERVLANKDIDCVVIAAPDKFHAQAIRTAAAAGYLNVLKQIAAAQHGAEAWHGRRLEAAQPVHQEPEAAAIDRVLQVIRDARVVAEHPGGLWRAAQHADRVRVDAVS